MEKRIKNIDIILPNRIGDTILSLPALICLKQLIQAYGADNLNISVYLLRDLAKILRPYNIFKIEQMNISNKVKSWLFPSNKAFFLCSTSETIGFHSKTSYGEVLNHKKYAKYHINMPYLCFYTMQKTFPTDLYGFLKDKFNLSVCSIRYFGICLELGYTVEQIKQTFNFSPEILTLEKDFSKQSSGMNYLVALLQGITKTAIPNLFLDLHDFEILKQVQHDDAELQRINYLVFCMEAAYGKITDTDRCWKEEYFYELAEYAHEKFGLNSVFIGVKKQIKIPRKPYFLDLRKKLSLAEIANLLSNSNGYIGNDTGPLHIANLIKKPSLGIYFREKSLYEYNPLFSQFNHPILNPQTPNEVFPLLNMILTDN